MKKKIGIVILATMMATLVACGNESKIGSNETSTVAIDNETENNTQENTTEEKHESNNDELSNEYLLSLPETTVEDFNYHEMDDGNIAIDRYWGTGGGDVVIVVPDEIDGKKVTKIAFEAFMSVWAKAIVLNENVNEISKDAFVGVRVDKLLICGDVKKIEEGTFTSSTVSAIELPDTLEEIDSGAFNMCNIEEITLPSNLKKIGDSAFIYSKLQKVYFKGGQVEVGLMAFSFCRKLTEVHILDCEVQFGKDVFESTENVTIFAPAGSAAEEYAKANDINFEILD